jgi:hypothetical protein
VYAAATPPDAEPTGKTTPGAHRHCRPERGQRLGLVGQLIAARRSGERPHDRVVLPGGQVILAAPHQWSRPDVVRGMPEISRMHRKAEAEAIAALLATMTTPRGAG